MTDTKNAERLRALYLNESKKEKNFVNICTATKNWNGCDYADIYAGAGCECWNQAKKHNCIRCIREKI